jgi:hypothetical protein
MIICLNKYCLSEDIVLYVSDYTSCMRLADPNYINNDNQIIFNFVCMNCHSVTCERYAVLGERRDGQSDRW